MKMFMRTCQSCGNKQEDKEPEHHKGKFPSLAYSNRKCKKCNSSDLDYGSWKGDDDEL